MKKLLITVLSLVIGLSARAADVPKKEDLTTMAGETFDSFAEATKKKDFTEFYESTAKLWQKQTSAKDLDKSFASFMTDEFDLPGAVEGKELVLTPAAKINEDGVLVIQGYYPTTPNKIYFTDKYIQEEGEWKLVGINVNIKK